MGVFDVYFLNIKLLSLDVASNISFDREQILLELLEVFDAVESPIDYLQANPEIPTQFIKRLPKILGNI
jgi:hypothetical protein